ncbi:GumC family protein [Bosea sp. TND4EK4]|uniref:GumC family protein n=1 Tax=Bosea sp. TND4EK4 TaxID=1907408 RepID=UPI0009540EA9|nr:GumC family protein [Bosea sp. TND4EK4]SIR07312.1 Uncharacterized protein involved in exopolysaccharide biosynthesis [Bosea sp. TND4EK4]
MQAAALEAGEQTIAAAPARPAMAFSLPEMLRLLRRRRRLVLASIAVCMLLAFAYAATRPPVYRATAEVLVDPTALQVVGKDIVRTDTSASIDFANVDSQALIMVSSGVLKQVVDDLGLVDDPAIAGAPGLLTRLLGKIAQPTPAERFASAIDGLKRAIVIQRVDNSLVFRITVSHPNAQKSAEIANTLAQAYLQQGIDGRRSAVERANASLIGQISGLRAQLDEAERAADEFRSKNGLISTGESGLVVTQQLRDLYSQIGQATAEVARQQARREQLSRVGSDPIALAEALPEAANSSSLTSLKGQYAQTSREIASLGGTLAPQHPRMIELRSELAETRRLMTSELTRIRASAQEGYRQAEANLANLQRRASELTRTQEVSSAAQIRLRQLQSEAEAIRVVYNASLQRAKELDQQKKIETNNSRLLSEAVPPVVSSKPPLALVLGAALLFGACLGLGLAYLLELLPAKGGLLPPLPTLSARLPRLPKLPTRPKPSSPPTPASAAAALGIGTVVSLPEAQAEKRAALRPVADTLEQRFGERLPATITVTGSLPAATLDSIADQLAQELALRGESVLIYQGDVGSRHLSIRRIGEDEPKPARRRHSFIIMRPATAEGRAHADADGVVLATAVAGQTLEALQEAADRAAPERSRIVALVVADPAGSPSREAGKVSWLSRFRQAG